jgi:hypothetical protein
MKYLKQYENYFDKDSLWTEPDGDAILKAFDEQTISDATKEVNVRPAFRGSDLSETTFRFKIADNFSIMVQLLEYPVRDPHIIITINGRFTDMPTDSEYRKEILERCFKTIK